MKSPAPARARSSDINCARRWAGDLRASSHAAEQTQRDTVDQGRATAVELDLDEAIEARQMGRGGQQRPHRDRVVLRRLAELFADPSERRTEERREHVE